MQVFITADIHHGIDGRSPKLTARLAEECLARARPGDVLVLAGDLACADGRGLEECLGRFASFPGPRAFVPGNHDLWSDRDSGYGSDVLYEQRLAEVASGHGFHLLDQEPLVVHDAGRTLAVAGSFGGFDFSLADLEELEAGERDEVRQGWRTGRFRGLFWNDYRFTWNAGGAEWDHAAFSSSCAARLRRQLEELESREELEVIVCVTHTGGRLEEIQGGARASLAPAAERAWFRGLSGSAAVGDAGKRSPRTRLHACGHTHHPARHEDGDGRLWVNVGCQYSRKRWLIYRPAASGEERAEFTEWLG